MSSTEIQDYYDRIAEEYDSDRFSNSYGQFIDRQERNYLATLDFGSYSLSLGCGSGRFMEFCTVGLDFSKEMLKVAEKQHPNKSFYASNAADTPFEEDTFDTIICFHVFMHLDKSTVQSILKEVSRILKPGGQFIVDVPSEERRKLTRYKSSGWHGANAYSNREIKNVLVDLPLQITNKRGVLFFPLHLLPKRMRTLFFPVDQFFCKIPTKKYSSYLIYRFVKPVS